MSDPSDIPLNTTFRRRIGESFFSGQVHSPTELQTAICALIVLRHSDEQEAEAEAMAVFSDTEIRPSIPPGVRWRDLCRLNESSRLAAWLTLPARLESCEDHGPGSLARRVAPALVAVGPRIAEIAFSIVSDLSLASIVERHETLDGLDDMFSPHVGHEQAQYGTPAPVARWIVSAESIRPDAKVYDPCFGYGSLLVEVVRRRSIAALDGEEPRRSTEGPTIFGVELAPGPFAIGLARVILAGEDQPALELGDALQRPLPLSLPSGGFDHVFAQPPFGVRWIPEADGGAWLTTVEASFMRHAMQSLAEGGTASLLLSQRALVHQGPTAAVRRELVSRMAIRDVTQVPQGVISGIGATHTRLRFARTTPGKSITYIVPRLTAPGGLPAQIELAEGNYAREETTLTREAVLASPDAVLVPQTRERVADALHSVRSLYPMRDLGDFIELRRGGALTANAHPGHVVTASMIVDDRIVLPAASRKLEGKRPAGRKAPLLRANDILLYGSTGGIRVALVENGAVGLVAHQSLLVLHVREDKERELSPRFLQRYIQSDAVRAALAESFLTRVLPRIDMRDVLRLPIPLPPLPVQDRILRAGDDVPILDALQERALRRSDPFEEWREHSGAVRALNGEVGGVEVATLLGRLTTFASEVIDLYEKNSDQVTWESHDVALVWFRRLVSASVHLLGLGSRPPSAETIVRLLLAQRDLMEPHRKGGAVRAAAEEGVLENRLERLIAAAIAGCAARHALDVEPRRGWRAHHGDTFVEISIANHGSVAVEEVKMDGAEVSLRIERLAPGESIEHTVRGSIAGNGDTASASVSLAFVQLDGTPRVERHTVTIDLRASSPDLSRPLDASPYITGASLTRSEMVYGRDPIFDDLARLFASPNAAPLVLLEGNKRVGKTSIMNQLLATRAPRGYVVSYATLQGAEGHSVGAGLTDREVWLHVAHSVGDALIVADLSVPPPETTFDPTASRFARKLAMRRVLSSYITEDHPYDAFVTWVDLVLEALGARRLLVMIDEFDKLQEGVEAGVTSPQLVENLRAVYLQRPNLGFVIAGGRRLARLRTEYFSALFGVGHRITVGPLPDDAARALVTEPVKGQLVWLPDARDEVVRRCAGHPFLIQSVCNQVFLRAAREDERRIGLPFVERALDEAVDGMDHFRTLWKQIAHPRRQLVLALCAVDAQRGEARDIGVLEEELASRGVRVPEAGVGPDLAVLDELELIALETVHGYQRYRLRLPIFAAWVQRRVDLGALAREAAIRDEMEDA